MASDRPETKSEEVVTTSRPLEGESLLQALGQIPVGERVEQAFSTHLVACISLGFARTAVPPLRQRSAELGHHPVSAALRHLSVSIAQKAVLDAAATYDQAGEGSSSLANALTLITRHLKNSTSSSLVDRKAAQQLIAGIRDSVITRKTEEIKAVQYWRNKWAGHRSMDPQVDPSVWANYVDFGVIETGLEQMRAAFHEFALLLTQVPELACLQDEALRIDDTMTRMGFSLDGTASWPLETTLGIGETQAREFLKRTLPVLTHDDGPS